MNISSLGVCICVIISKFLPILLYSFDIFRVMVVIYAHLLGPLYVWCFCPLDNLVFKIYLYSNHTVFPAFFVYGCFKSFLLSCNFGCSSAIRVLTVYESGHRNTYFQAELVQSTLCLMFSILFDILICIALHL